MVLCSVNYIILMMFCSILAPLRGEVFVKTSEWIFPEDQKPTPSCHASTITETPSGRLVAAWFGGTAEGEPDVGIWMAQKDPDGEWSHPIQIATGQIQGRPSPCWNPVLYQWKNQGPLVLYYKVGDSVLTWHGEFRLSYDEGRTWGERNLLPEGFLGPIKNKPIQLADGSLLAGSSQEDHGWWRVHLETQKQFGSTWSRTASHNLPDEEEAIQPTILTYPNGRIQLLCRPKNGEGEIQQIWSDDYGKSWGKIHSTSLPNPNSGIDAATLANGCQLLVYNPTHRSDKGRGKLSVAMSRDGENWMEQLVLEEDDSTKEYSYPAVIQTEDTLIHITYTWNRVLIKHWVLEIN